VGKDQATKIQILSVKHPGLLHAVDTMFEKYSTLLQVQRMLEREYHEEIALTSIRTYKQKHWWVFKHMIREQKAAMKAVNELVGEDGLTAGVNALLWQELQGMTATQLMAFKKICNDSAKVELMKKQFALLAREHRQKMKERAAALQAGKPGEEVVEDFDAARRMVEQAKEIFGIGRTAIAPPAWKLPGPADETPSPGAPVGSGKSEL